MPFPTLLHSVSYSGSWGQARLTVDEFIDKAAELGFDGVMLMAKRPHLSLLDCDAKQRSQLRRHLEKRGLSRICVAAYNNITGDWEHRDVPHQEMQVHYLTELARLTLEIGGDLLRIFTGYEIAVGFESQYELIRAVDEPNCKAMFDAWAPALHGADVEAAAVKMAPIMCHTTVANYQRLPRYQYQPALTNYQELPPWMQAVPMDEGFIDYPRFLSALETGGFAGSISYEMCSPLRDGGGLKSLDRYALQFLESIARFQGSFK